MNINHEQHLQNLNPGLREAVEKAWPEAQRIAEQNGYRLHIICSKRSQEEQDRLWAQGRTAPGKRVTWTRTSRHTSGNAVDFGLYDDIGYAEEREPQNTFHCYHAIWKLFESQHNPCSEMGVTWLGAKGDPAHFQWSEVPHD